MKCVQCENKKNLTSKRVVLRYTASGLDNVTLHNILEWHCDQCGERYHEFPNLEQLHQLIADVLIQKPIPLDHKEVRFLREHLGYSSKMFARLMGYTYATVSRFESDSRPIPLSFDHALRAMVYAKRGSADRNYDLHEKILKESDSRKNKSERVELSQKGSKWILTECHA